MDATTAAIVANKRAAVLNVTARLVELDAVPIAERMSWTYTVGQQTYGYNEYRASLVAEVERLEKSVEQTIRNDVLANGPFEFTEITRG